MTGLNRKSIKVVVSTDSPPENLIEAIKWLNQKLNEIPEEYRDSANIEFDSERTYFTYMDISYRRLETDEEAKNRIDCEDSEKSNEIQNLERRLKSLKRNVKK